MNYKEAKQRGLLGSGKQAEKYLSISGPKAKMYINDELFRSEGIRLRYMDYSSIQNTINVSPFEQV